MRIKILGSLHDFGTLTRNINKPSSNSPQGLAKLANLSQATIMRTENAQFAVTLDVLLSIIEALNIPLRDLVNFFKD